MLPSSLRKFTFISLLLLLHAFVPVLSIPVQPRPSLARSLDTTTHLQSDTALLKPAHIPWTDASLSNGFSRPHSDPVDHRPHASSRLFARTYLDPHGFDHLHSTSQPHIGMVVDHRAAASLGRRSIFDKIKHAFQSFGKKVKEGFQKVGSKIKQGFQNFGKKVKGAFQKAGEKIKQGFQKVKGAFQTAGKKIKEGFQTAGKKIKQGFQTVGNKIKQGFQKVKQGFQTAGRKIKEGFQTAGKKMKEGFIKAGKWIKDTGAKVAKFGLKVISTAASVVGRVASFIPGVGKVISKGLSGVSKLTDLASSKIHADLGSKLNKGMDIMNKIEHPVSGAAGKVLDAILKRDMSENRIMVDKIQHPIAGVAGHGMDKVLRRALSPTVTELFERDSIDGDELSRRDFSELDERGWDGDSHLEARSSEDDSNLLSHPFNDYKEETHKAHGFQSKRPLFRKDP